MKVYVSEMPKGCLTCPYIVDKGDYDLCAIKDYVIDDAFKYVDKRKKSCPLQSLADYTKQVRKEVCEEIRNKLKPKEIFHPEDEFEIDYDFYYKEDVEEVLDQIQGETK